MIKAKTRFFIKRSERMFHISNTQCVHSFDIWRILLPQADHDNVNRIFTALEVKESSSSKSLL
jgi:hypothetical protein